MVRPRPAAPDPAARRITFRQHGVGVWLLPGEGVFSAAAVDPGTTFLLRWLAGVPARRVLDLGCGYGPLGLWLAAADSGREVLAVDRDAVALECTQAGAEANGLAARVRTLGSLGYDDLDPADRFDLVVSNVPAKVGSAALAHLLLDAWWHLEEGGRVAVVVVDRLAAEVAALLDDPAVVVDEHHANRAYASWTYRFRRRPAGAAETPGFERGVYRRAEATFHRGGLSWAAATSHTLGEFDTLHHATEAAVDLLGAHARSLSGPVAIVGAGQGHLGLALRAAAGEDVPVRLVDRDLLALRTAAANLGGPRPGALEVRHVARPAGHLGGCGSAIVALPQKEPVALTAARLGPALEDLPPGAPIVVHGRAADVARVLDLLRAGGRRLAAADRRAVRGGVALVSVTPPG